MPWATKEQEVEYHKKWYQKNRFRVLKAQKAYQKANPDKVRETKNRWRDKNKERIALVNTEWVKNNPDKMKAAQDRYLSKNREVRAKYARLYRQKSPDIVAMSQKKWRSDKKHKILEYSHRRRALLLGNTVGEVNIKKLLDEWNGNCGLCGLEVLTKYHIDHIIPLSKQGKHEQSNLQVTHARCNQVKHNKLILEGAK